MVPSVSFRLSSAWSKLARSDEHLQALHKKTRAFFDSNPYAFGLERDLEHSRYVFSTLLVTPPPPKLGPIFGDYIHNLRCALDHLAWQLALIRYGGMIPTDAERQIQYPIGKDLTSFRCHSALPHFKREHVTFMEGFQTAQGGPSDLLMLIRELSNTDKHRIMHPLAVSIADQTPDFVATKDAVIRDVSYVPGKLLVENTEFATVAFEKTGPDPEVEMRGLPVVLSFGDAPDSALRPMQDIVTQVLHEATEAFFGT
jgi:hypothetical protein